MGILKEEPQEDPVAMAERSTAQAFEALDALELEEAAEIAAQLREIRFSSWFEIQALVELKRGEPEAAIEVLREGVQTTPHIWLLWELLGNTLSNQGQPEEAMNCYETALKLDLDEGARASLQFNQATVLSNHMGKSAEALEIVEQWMDSPELWPALKWRYRARQLQLLADLERCAEVRQLALEFQDMLSAISWDDEAFQELAVSWASGGFALLDCGEASEARRWALQALEIERTTTDALQLLRFSNPLAQRADRYYEVMLEGVSDEKDEKGEELGFFTSYTVIASTAEEAERLALEMEQPRWKTPLKVEECELGDECEETFVGVWDVGIYNLFPLHEDEE